MTTQTLLPQLRPPSRWLGLTIMLMPLLTLAAAAQYVGETRCKICHLPQSKSWKPTKMANAFDLLKPGVAAEQKKAKKLDPARDYTKDATCLPCHTTGYGKPGGFESVEKTPNLVGVQCEVCHGAGRGYLKPELMSIQNKEYKRAQLVAAGLVVPDENLCKTCHNPKSPFYQPFDYAKRKTDGVHAHTPLKYAHQ